MSAPPNKTRGNRDDERRREIVEVIFGAYPSKRRAEGDASRYAVHLASVSPLDLGQAAMVVTEHHPTFMPSAGEFKALAIKLARQRRPPKEAPKPMPPAFSLSQDNPFAQLAAEFEQESREKGPLPRSAYAQRARRIWHLLDSIDSPINHRMPNPTKAEIRAEAEKF